MTTDVFATALEAYLMRVFAVEIASALNDLQNFSEN